ncbi:MAG: TetR/AcrR family transcriptional regulator [Acidimicrobiia bacterium]|nr:TetR/AcrR family transcriptional regulator [Acidimicrobiia bacterium]
MSEIDVHEMNTRKYTSELRVQQAEKTRERILDALVEVLAEGVESLSMPAVAERAGVSVGTVYRHFGDKAGLLKALYAHAGRRTGIEVESIPRTLDELDDVLRRVFQHFEDTDDLMRAAFASRIGREVRIEQTAERLEGMTQTLRSTNPSIPSDQLEHLARLMFILTTSDVYMQWKDRLGLDPEDAADEVMWTLRAVIRGIGE